MSRLLWYPGHELFLDDVVRAGNCSLWDAQGRRYVDLESGVWCTALGHAHPRLLRVLAEQAGRIAHTGFAYASPVVEEAAEEVLALLGFEGGRCVFLCSGSEAVEYGVRVAQAASAPRTRFLTMADSYFGAYGSAHGRSRETWHDFDWSGCAACAGCPPACPPDCPRWAAVPWDRIGGFLFEPGSSSGFVRFPPAGLIRSIAQAVRDAGGLVLVNEVTTGTGRTGEWFGFQHYGLRPDVVALGKGIGNGYPVAVAAFAPGVIDRLGGEPPRYAQSHQNDPLGAAIVREVIRTIREERLIERGREIGAAFVAGLERVRERTGRIRAIRGRGMMIAIDLEPGPQDRPAAAAEAARVHRELFRRGFLVERRPDSATLRIDPALTVEREDLEAFLRVFEEVLAGPPSGPPPDRRS